MAGTRHFDVLTVSDLRLPGGTSSSIAEELRAQGAAGWRSGVLQIESRLVQRARPINPLLVRCVEDRVAEPVIGPEPVSCRLLVLRHPTVVLDIDPATTPSVEAERVVLVANQSPGTPDGKLSHYDPVEVEAHLHAWLGEDVTVVWAPIGPLVRDNLRLVAPDLVLRDDDWVNIIDVHRWAVDRSAGITGVPRIGRHSRDHALKWPADPDLLLAAYPEREDVRVEILGGASSARAVLGRPLPRNWNVQPFGAVPPERFLANVDVLVYFHHPDWVEAFGRTILEGLASGTVVIAPPHFEALFGDVCTYAEPADVTTIVRELAEDPSEFVRRSEAGRRFVAERFGHAAHVRRVSDLLGTSAPTLPPTDAPTTPAAPTVLFVSSNGAGVGHLMRLMAVARRLEGVQPIFLTLSQALAVVHEQGLPVEYLVSRQYADVPVSAWHDLLHARLTDLIETYEARAVVFDGTWPYKGLLRLTETHPDVPLVWSRRGMWREGITNPTLAEAHRFALIIEPGEFARDADRGVTRTIADGARKVAPITFLGREEQLDRAQAREEMGLDPDRPAALVQLGAGNINDVGSLVGTVVRRLAAEPGMQVCVTRSVIASGDVDLPGDVRTISVYPLARYLAAFDLAVAASGYNTYHELVATPVPTLFVPNLETSTDDQEGRARFAEQVGVGRMLHEVSAEGLEAALAPLLDGPTRDRMRELAEARSTGNGAPRAARAVEALLRGEHDPAPHPEPEEPAPRRRRPSASSRRPSGEELLPRALHLLGRVVRRLLASSRVRSAVGPVAARLTPELRGLARAALGSPTTGVPRPAPGGGDRLPVTPGTVLPDGERDGLRGVAIVLHESLGREELHAVVERVAVLQLLHRSFAPLFVTGSTDAGVFRRHGYSFEFLPPPTTWAPLIGEAAFERHRRARLAEVGRRWEVAGLIELRAVDDVDRLLVPSIA